MGTRGLERSEMLPPSARPGRPLEAAASTCRDPHETSCHHLFSSPPTPTPFPPPPFAAPTTRVFGPGQREGARPSHQKGVLRPGPTTCREGTNRPGLGARPRLRRQAIVGEMAECNGGTALRPSARCSSLTSSSAKT